MKRFVKWAAEAALVIAAARVLFGGPPIDSIKFWKTVPFTLIAFAIMDAGFRGVKRLRFPGLRGR